MFDKTQQIAISEQDHINLTSTIIEAEACAELFKVAQSNTEIPTESLRTIMSYYMGSLRTHKLLWNEILTKTVGEELAGQYHSNWKYDIYKKVVFFQEHQNGCGCSI